ncbi:Zn-dependent hydrolase [Clostridium sp. C105KSO13]|uniref:Zn-dependent hydrolase n=1 Tax=Clostridium sp. C105KSO13 TaxID=1776045 RepID=UPI0007406F4D|nr:Zn-dependent hydrolase [Clostridium sp. C105KSO13]CUX48413.1 N-carbamoyl-L-amino acid hydrolase [Clostridium sp. C105KSO13]
MVNKEQLWEWIQTLGTIGKNPDGSVTRFPFTNEDREAGEYLKRLMREAGLAVREDAVGNIIGEWEGRDKSLPVVLTGSHYDTVQNGGKFDGTLGVLAAIESVQTMREAGFIPKHSIRVIGFKDEEGNRFGYGMIGSKAVCGLADPNKLKSKDENGITLYQAMKDFGVHPDKLDSCEMNDLQMFVELHIEQGKVLEERRAQIGIVTGIAGVTRFEVTVTGESGHAGSTPMKGRKDPVVAMSKWITRLTLLAETNEEIRATVGEITTVPGVRNVICAKVRFSLDIRALDNQEVRIFMKTMEAYGRELETQHGVQIQLVPELSNPSHLCSEKYRHIVDEICLEKNILAVSLTSGAGHDCMNFAGKCDTALIFVPSERGLSHRKEEYTSKEDCAVGAEVLCEFLKRTAC